MPHMIYMDSKSANDGTYTLTVTFDVGTDQDIAAVDVQNQVAIAQRQLPQQVLQQGSHRGQAPAADPAGGGNRLRRSALRLSVPVEFRHAARVRRAGARARRRPGRGIRRARLRHAHLARPGKMARLGVTTEDVSGILNEQNVVAPAGTVGAEPAPPGQQMQYVASVKGRLSTPEEYGQHRRAHRRRRRDRAPQGHCARRARRHGLFALDQLNGVPTAIIGVYQLPDANALEVARGVRRRMDGLAPTSPRASTIRYRSTRPCSYPSRCTRWSRPCSTRACWSCWWCSSSWRAGAPTLIPMLAVPVSLIGAFSAFAALGFSLNTLTLFALVLAIGLVVDDAIVVVEAVTQIMDSRKLSPPEATKAAMKEVSGPVIAIALVLISVFVPVSFLGGLTGQFYRQFALTLAVSVGISVIVALTLTPALCALLLKPTAESHFGGTAGPRLRCCSTAAFERFTGATRVGAQRHPPQRAIDGGFRVPDVSPHSGWFTPADRLHAG